MLLELLECMHVCVRVFLELACVHVCRHTLLMAFYA